MDVGSDVGSDVGPPAPTLDEVAAEARACTLCAPVLPLGPRPILRVSPTARLLIASQAPGTKVHVSGTPWTDASGERAKPKAWKEIWGSGQGVGSVAKILPAAELIARFKKEYDEAIDPPL